MASVQLRKLQLHGDEQCLIIAACLHLQCCDRRLFQGEMTPLHSVAMRVCEGLTAARQSSPHHLIEPHHATSTIP